MPSSKRPTETQTQFESGSWQADVADLVPGLTVLYHPDMQRVGDRVSLPELNGRERVDLSRTSPFLAPPGRDDARSLGDPRLSRKPIALQGDGNGGVRFDASGSATALEIDGVALRQCQVSAEQVSRGVVLLLGKGVVLLLHRLDPWVPDDLPRYGLVGESAAMLSLRRDLRHVAPLDVSVLLRGESGTGKELVARALHEAGPRRGQPYVTVNLAALPPSLAASELFGAERGAFTGAHRARQGYFQRADGGTLFLDEVGDAPTELQVQLLRALESGEVQPVGAHGARPVDVRVVAATDADLQGAMDQGTFRAPLFYRLSSFTMYLPPLRARRDDLGRLLVALLRQELASVGAEARLRPHPWLPAGLVAQLAMYDWPGNVRQLRNVVRQLVISYRDQDTVRLGMPLAQLLGETPPESATAASSHGGKHRSPSALTEDEVRDALRTERWRLQAAADRLGIPRSSLYRLIERHPNLHTAADLDPQNIDDAIRRHGNVEAAAMALEVSATGLRRRLRQLGLHSQDAT